ncbi:MAG: 30S ribosomal protein S4 [Candidatus Berkelbacteria bacterium]|nr:30S ribosomal protein S4 [Candidatus Berkelbacteria bacterium]
MNHGCRKCRREGVKLFLKGEKCFLPKCPVTLRPYAPGQHGPNSFSKLSEYGKQLREKQKVKKIYGLSETQLRNYYLKSAKKAGDKSENLLRMIETRLDSIIFRLGIVASRSNARQMVSHRKFLVNGRRVNIPSINVSEKDEVSFTKEVKMAAKSNLPDWLVFDGKKLSLKLKRKPTKEELEMPFDINLVIEYYSR